MARRILTNEKDKWEVYSTISGGVIAQFDSEHDLKVWMANEEIYTGKMKAIETLMTFPDGWTINDEKKLIKGGLGKFHRWQENLDYDSYEEKYRLIDEKLEELTKA